MALWEHNYLAWAVGRAQAQGFAGGGVWRDQVARFQLSLFTSPDYARANAAPYVVAIGEQDGGGPALLHDAWGRSSARPIRRRRRQRRRCTLLYYTVDARLMLLEGVRRGWAGAQEALDYLLQQMAPTRELSLHAGWAIAAP